ncbi:MAG: glycosyl transferase family 1, partial [Acidobacteria bacterium]
MARGLAERGHQVFVVTNASEVENAFRMQLTDQDERLLEPRFEASGGCVRVVQTPGTTLKYRYIPWANPFVSRLASLACQTVREYGCDAIYSYYFEPYSVAAHLASRWTSVPYIVKHAGSDLGRLMDLPDLKTAYEEILKAANLVVTDPGHKEYFAGLGVSANRIFTGLVFSLPTEFFHPGAEPIDVTRVLQSLAASARLAGRSTPACRTD